MILLIPCLIWVGVTLSAPTWYYILLGIVAVAKIFKMIGND